MADEAQYAHEPNQAALRQAHLDALMTERSQLEGRMKAYDAAGHKDAAARMKDHIRQVDESVRAAGKGGSAPHRRAEQRSARG
jgi:hypothetical protein